MRRLLALAALLAVAALAGAGSRSAEAAFPGRNGLIVFVSDRSPLRFGEIYSLDARTGRVSRMTANRRTELAPVRAPRGDRLAFVGDDGVYVGRPDGNRARRVAVVPRAWWRVGLLEWSPGGDRLAYVAGSSVLVENVGRDDASGTLCCTATLMVLDLDTGVSRALKVNRGAAFGPEAAWSPDSTRLVFVDQVPSLGCYRHGSRDVCPPSDLYTVAAEGGPVRRLGVFAGAERPAFSPDGTRLVYGVDEYWPLALSEFARPTRELALANASGADPRYVAGRRGRPGTDHSPDWQPLP